MPDDPSNADDPSIHDSSKHEEYADLLRLELAEVRATHDRADRKSQIMLGYTGVTLALSITILGKWLGKSPVDTKVTVLACGSIFFLSIAAVLLMLVVCPQLSGPGRRHSWSRLISDGKSGEDVLNMIIAESSYDRIARLAHLIHALAVRAMQKHRGIQLALAIMLVGSTLLGAATIVRG